MSGSAGSGPSIAPSPSWVAIPEDADFPTVLDFLVHRFPRIDPEIWVRRLREGKVADDDGRTVAAGDPCIPHTRLSYFREVADEPRIPLRERILYRDEHLLVADKPHFLPVVPAGRYVNECLLYRLRQATGEPELTPVHRLDRATAGLVLCSLRRDTRGAYTQLFAERAVTKEYLAVCRISNRVSRAPKDRESGEAAQRPVGRRWTLEDRLERGTPPFRIRRALDSPANFPPNAVTHVELLARQGDLAVFRAVPETGKKHQIRFHLADLGFPILHERYYPKLLPEAPLDLERPLQLLARRLVFQDPVTGEERTFVSHRRLAWDIRGSALSEAAAPGPPAPGIG